MKISKIQKIIKKFEKERGWDKTSSLKIIKFIKKEIKEFKIGNKTKRKEKIYDIFRESIQLANRYDMDLEKAFKKGIKKSEKKYPVKK